MADVDPYMSSIYLWPIPYAPQYYTMCNGQQLPINEYQALYSLLGPRFGGDSRTYFNLPDMRGRVPVGAGQLLNGSLYQLAATGGTETIQLNLTQCAVPPHTHSSVYTEAEYMIAATGTVTPNAKIGPGALTNNPVNNYMGPGGSTNCYASSANASMGNMDFSISVAITEVSSGSVTVGEAGATGYNVGSPHENRMPFLALNYIIAVDGTYPINPN